GLQKILYQQRQSLLDQKTNKSGPCYGLSSTSNDPMAVICNNQVPDFLATVNAVREQTDHKTAKSFTIQMPNLSKTKYSALTGICGAISWNAYDPNELKKAKDVGVDKDNLETIELSRAIAIQQMYSSLT